MTAGEEEQILVAAVRLPRAEVRAAVLQPEVVLLTPYQKELLQHCCYCWQLQRLVDYLQVLQDMPTRMVVFVLSSCCRCSQLTVAVLLVVIPMV